MQPLEKRVEAMAAVLDEKRPGWRQEINIDALDFNSVEVCTLGQLYGEFVRGLDALGHDLDDDAWLVDHAMELSYEERHEDILYDSLTNAWKAYLRKAA
jgi:hypothetical protein